MREWFFYRNNCSSPALQPTENTDGSVLFQIPPKKYFSGALGTLCGCAAVPFPLYLTPFSWMHSLLVRGAEFNFLPFSLLLTHALNTEFLFMKPAYMVCSSFCLVSTAVSQLCSKNHCAFLNAVSIIQRFSVALILVDRVHTAKASYIQCNKQNLTR